MVFNNWFLSKKMLIYQNEFDPSFGGFPPFFSVSNFENDFCDAVQDNFQWIALTMFIN